VYVIDRLGRMIEPHESTAALSSGATPPQRLQILGQWPSCVRPAKSLPTLPNVRLPVWGAAALSSLLRGTNVRSQDPRNEPHDYRPKPLPVLNINAVIALGAAARGRFLPSRSGKHRRKMPLSPRRPLPEATQCRCFLQLGLPTRTSSGRRVTLATRYRRHSNRGEPVLINGQTERLNR
jgi:hypothetical protein